MSVKCGNHKGADVRHETVADVRACYAVPTAPVEAGADMDAIHAEAIKEDGLRGGLWRRLGEAVKALDDQGPDAEVLTREGAVSVDHGGRNFSYNPFFKSAPAPQANDAEKTWSQIQNEKLAGRRPNSYSKTEANEQDESWPWANNRPAGRSYPTTTAQDAYIGKLLAERDWKPFGDEGILAKRVSEGWAITSREAALLIDWLKAQPKTRRAPLQTSAWRELAGQVPAGYYAYADESGKNHFFRVAIGRNGFFKIQEQASDDLHDVKFGAYPKVLKSILAIGLAEAGRRYATDRGKCYRCNRTLTDNVGNPYFAAGLGPECGGK